MRAGVRLELSSIKPDSKEVCRDIRQGPTSHCSFVLKKFYFFNKKYTIYLHMIDVPPFLNKLIKVKIFSVLISNRY